MTNREEPEIIDGRFELHELIGQGAQARTYRGLDRQTGQFVAIKELLLHHVDSWKAVELFEREGQVLGQLAHPNIPAYVANVHVTGDDGRERFFLAQELVEGQNLKVLMEQGLRFDEAQAVDFLRQILDILVYLQGLSPVVLHRDIKPSNIIRRPDGSLALIDFGAVQAVMPSAQGGSTVVGTTGYMPVEQLMGRADTSTDLYSLGATTVHLLSQQHPNSLPMEDLRLQFAHAINVSPTLERYLSQMLVPEANRRFRDARQALEALEAAQRPQPQRPPQRPQRQSTDNPIKEPGEKPVRWLLFGAQIFLAFILLMMSLDSIAATLGASYLDAEIYKIPRPLHALQTLAFVALAFLLVVPRWIPTRLHLVAPSAILGGVVLFLNQLLIVFYDLRLEEVDGSTGPGFVWFLFFLIIVVAVGRAFVTPHRRRGFVAGIRIPPPTFLVGAVVLGLQACLVFFFLYQDADPTATPEPEVTQSAQQIEEPTEPTEPEPELEPEPDPEYPEFTEVPPAHIGVLTLGMTLDEARAAVPDEGAWRRRTRGRPMPPGESWLIQTAFLDHPMECNVHFCEDGGACSLGCSIRYEFPVEEYRQLGDALVAHFRASYGSETRYFYNDGTSQRIFWWTHPDSELLLRAQSQDLDVVRGTHGHSNKGMSLESAAYMAWHEEDQRRRESQRR